MVVHPVVCSVFIGRSEELAALHAARRALARSRGSLVLIGGDAGIGKTRLLDQFLTDVERDSRPRVLATAECLEFAEQPFGAFRGLYAALGKPFPGTRGDLLEKPQIFAGVADDVRGLASTRATILAIEDVHWADRSSLELLTYLAGRIGTSRLLLIATYRSDALARNDGLSSAIARVSREATTVRLALDPLGATEMREFLGHAYGDRPPPAGSLLESVARRSEGNPFYAEELLKDALDARHRGDETVPFSIRASVTERLTSLNDADRQILAHAALLGYRFDPNVLALTTGATLETVLPALRRACDLNVLVEASGTADRFRFRHALSRDVVYATTLRFDAKRTHERILATLESLPDAGRHLDSLAYHAWAARNREKTVTYNRLAGDAALDMRALDEARTFYERVLEAVDRGGRDEASALETFGTIAEMQGRIAHALEHFDTAFERYCDIGDYDGAANARRQACAASSNLGDPRALDAGRAFLATHGARIGGVAKGSLLALLARLATVGRGDYASTREFLAQIATCGPLPARARQNELVARMDLASHDGDTETWAGFVPELLALQGALPPFLSAISLVALGQSASSLGFGTIADDAFARARRVEREWDFGAFAKHAAAVRARHAFTYGRVAATRAEIALARRGSEAAVGTMALAIVAPHAAVAFADDALMPPELEQNFAMTRRDGSSIDDALILCAAAAWNLRQRRAEEARSDLRLAIRLTPRVLAPLGPLLALAASHLDETDLEPVRDLLRGSLHPSDRAGRANVMLADAILERRFGRPDRGAARAREAARAFAELEWPFLEMHALSECGAPEEARAVAQRLGLAAPAGAPDAAGAPLLTARERDVARQIASGATNAEIAERLSVSLGTVEKYVAKLFVKLDVKRRSQIAATYARLSHGS